MPFYPSNCREDLLFLIFTSNGIPKSSKGSCGKTTPRRQYGDSELVEAARYATPGETGCFFPPARRGSGDRLANALFTILKQTNKQTNLYVEINYFELKEDEVYCDEAMKRTTSLKEKGF